MKVEEAIKEAKSANREGVIQYNSKPSNLAKLDEFDTLRWINKNGRVGLHVSFHIITNPLWQPYIEKKACSSCVIYKELIATANYNTQSTMKRLLNVLKTQQCTNKNEEECK